MNGLEAAAFLTIVGMGVVFTALLLLAVSIHLLKIFFPVREAGERLEPGSEIHRVAILAAAVRYMMDTRDATGKALLAGGGPWGAAARIDISLGGEGIPE